MEKINKDNISFNEQTIDFMFDLANSVRNNPYIIEMKKRIEKGDIEQNIAKELDRLRYLKKEFPQHPPTKELIWLLVNYLFGNIKRVKTLLEIDIITKQKDELFLNIVKSHELVISFMLDKGLIEIEKLKEEIEIFKIGFPDDKVTKFSERALNNYLSKKTLPPKPLHFSGTITPHQLDNLYNGLTIGGYMPLDPAKETYKAFLYVFGGIGNPEDYKPLKWEKSKSLLAYFIDVLSFTFKKKGERTDWKFAEIAFNVENLRGSKNDYQKFGQPPIGHVGIDNLLKYL